MTSLRILAATGDHLLSAQSLIFEYMAATQGERGHDVPAGIHQLPEVLRSECVDLAAAYRPPGALFVAYEDDQPIGCVGLKPVPPRTMKVRRLYVRLGHRRSGVARQLMQHAHRHAAEHGFSRLFLDVMPTRTHVIAFYRSLGYIDAPPYVAESDPMIYLQRTVNP